MKLTMIIATLLAAFAVGGGIAFATDAGPLSGGDVSGPCDEAEHANDPRCTGGAVGGGDVDRNDDRGRNRGPGGGDDRGGDDDRSGRRGGDDHDDRSGSNRGSDDSGNDDRGRDDHGDDNDD